jgi:alpha-L-fucosidase
VRTDGRTAWVRITSLAGQPLRLLVADWDSAVVRETVGATPRLTRSSAKTFVIDLPKGSSVLLAPSRAAPLPALTPVARADTGRRPWPALKPDSQPARYQDRPDMAWWRASMDSLNQRLRWWRDARFGMFIHWGVYSQLAGVWDSAPVRGYAEHIQRIRKIPSVAYREQAVSQFNPTRFDADEWVNLARRAGMRYMIITAKHHDGFAMYDSKVTDYDIVDATPFKRDPLRELRDAAKRRGVRFGFYYSHAFDWGDPEAPGNDWEFDNPGGDRNLYGGREWWINHPQLLAKARRYVDRKAIPQILELIKNYDPDIMWFDTPHKLPPEENLRILRAVREAKPTIVVNGRPVQAFPGAPEARFGDYASTADRPAEFTRHEGDWEAIPTTNESYGYHRMDLSHKPPEHFVQLLAKAAARGGNLLMNIGPMGDGRFDPKDAAILEGIGTWMEVNAEAIRGTTRTPLPVQTWGQSTRKGSRLYLHVFDWPRDGHLHVAGLKAQVTNAYLLAEPNAGPLTVRRVGDRDVEIDVPKSPTDPWDSVIAVDLAGTIEPDSAIYLPTSGPAIRLHVFDGRQVGEGIRYGDGKRGRDVAQGWNRTDSGIDWDVRLSEAGRFRVALEYATSTPQDSGTFEITVGANRLSGRVIPTAGDTVFASRDVGEIALPPGAITLSIRPSGPLEGGAELLRLRRITLTPLPRQD